MEGVVRQKRKADAPSSQGRSQDRLDLNAPSMAFIHQPIDQNASSIHSILGGIQDTLKTIVLSQMRCETQFDKVDDFMRRLEFCEERITKVETNLTRRITALEAKVSSLEKADTSEDVKRALGGLEDRLTMAVDSIGQLEKKNNLLFVGVPESQDERGPALREKVVKILTSIEDHMMDNSASLTTQLAFVTRLGRNRVGPRPRPLLVRFKTDYVPTTLWDMRRDIRLALGAGDLADVPASFGIRHDLTQRQRAIRQRLMPIHNLAFEEKDLPNARLERAFFDDERLFVVPKYGRPLPVVINGPDTRWRGLFVDMQALNEAMYGPVGARAGAPRDQGEGPSCLHQETVPSPPDHEMAGAIIALDQ